MTIAVVLLLISMGLDVFAGGLALGIAGLPSPRWTRTAAVFAGFGVVLLALGVLIGRLLSDTLGSVASYLAGGLLLILGLRAVGDVILGGHDEGSNARSAEPKSALLAGLVVSLDKLAGGVFVVLGAIIVYQTAANRSIL
jgi:putative Mn2+ efflux pump MntP